MQRLTGKVAVVTGSSRGIGKAVALRFGEEGAKVVVVARRKTLCEETAKQICRKGGEAFVRKRFKADHVDRGMRLFQRYGLLMLVVPALLPPPAPFKIFVLLAGVVAIPVWQFVAAIGIARGIRYGGEGLLAVLYGEQALTFLHDHAKGIGLGLAAVALVAGGAWIAWQRRTRV